MFQLSTTNTFAIVLVVCAAVLQVEAFTIFTSPRTSLALQASNNGRRNFLDAAMSTTAGLVIASIPAMAGAEEATAGDDLAMPSVEETTKADAAAVAERLRRKAELQKEKSRPASFKDSLAKEKEKQKGLQMSKQERRDALCEELGRGC